MKITAEPTDAVRSYLAQIGAKGGSIKGAGKKRGGFRVLPSACAEVSEGSEEKVSD